MRRQPLKTGRYPNFSGRVMSADHTTYFMSHFNTLIVHVLCLKLYMAPLEIVEKQARAFLPCMPVHIGLTSYADRKFPKGIGKT